MHILKYTKIFNDTLNQRDGKLRVSGNAPRHHRRVTVARTVKHNMLFVCVNRNFQCHEPFWKVRIKESNLVHQRTKLRPKVTCTKQLYMTTPSPHTLEIQQMSILHIILDATDDTLREKAVAKLREQKGFKEKTLVVEDSPRLTTLEGLKGLPFTCVEVWNCKNLQDISALKAFAAYTVHDCGKHRNIFKTNGQKYFL